uniref:ER degradation-enhancing alpha-mannosidase-like protein 3 n=1 Tax=Styela clava TaxID=7725 RepID=UPI0019395B5F|nr:ER degradation-enhancing alpha-mannosidase-like protein 3 [Styela clava]
MYLNVIFKCQKSRSAAWLQFLLLSIVMCGLAWDPEWIMPTNKLSLREKVVEMFTHAYTSYMDHAYPADELMPIACKGRIRGVTLSRGDVDDTLGNFSLTLIDTLDTLAVLGMYDEFEEAVHKVQNDVKFDADLVVSVFETNIRVLGGLLGGHAAALEIQSKHNRMKWYNNTLLYMAKEVGDKLLPAFNTTTGIPMSRVNLATGAVRKVKDKDTCTACAGTMIMEMAALSRFTGDPIYEQKARKAMDYLWSRRQRSSDLMGTVLSVNNGEWIRKESGVGAGIDSYYEYLLKSYILYADEEYLQRFNTHYSAIKQYIKQGPLLIDVHMHKPNVAARNFIDALGAFWPGLLVLKGDLQPAIENHELLYQVFLKHKFLPEAFTTNFDIYWGQYPLRPEFAESTYLLYKATADPYYLEVGKTIIENLEKHARVKCGYAGIKDVRTFKHEDRMDSYFLAEMFKYLYLLFTPDKELSFLPNGKSAMPGINMDDYLLTTEAHLLPLNLSNMAVKTNDTAGKPWHAAVHATGNAGRHCPNNELVRPTNLRPIQNIREKVKQFFREIHPEEPRSCKSANPFQTIEIKEGTIKWTGPRSLHAKDFQAANKDHLDLIKLMGITTKVMQEGTIQLEWQPNSASSPTNAKEGQIFMYEMEEMRKTSADTQVTPVLVQLLSQPYLGAVVLKAGPAQFGPDLNNVDPVSGPLVYANPYDGCSPLVNADEIKGKIAITQRGGCMFVIKVKNIENAGGIGAIIEDNTAETKFGEGPTFTMAGDGETSTGIPSAFLFAKEASILHTCIGEFQAEGRPPLEVLIGTEGEPLEEVMRKYANQLPIPDLENRETNINDDGEDLPNSKEEVTPTQDTQSILDEFERNEDETKMELETPFRSNEGDIEQTQNAVNDNINKDDSNLTKDRTNFSKPDEL